MVLLCSAASQASAYSLIPFFLASIAFLLCNQPCLLLKQIFPPGAVEPTGNLQFILFHVSGLHLPFCHCEVLCFLFPLQEVSKGTARPKCYQGLKQFSRHLQLSLLFNL